MNYIEVLLALIPALIAVYFTPIIIEHHKDEPQWRILVFFAVLLSILLSFYYTLLFGLLVFVVFSIVFIRYFVSKDKHLIALVSLIIFMFFSTNSIYDDIMTKKISNIVDQFQKSCSSISTTVENFEWKYTNAPMKEIADDIYDKCYEPWLRIENYVPDNDN